jgi:hypothetical protein
VKRQKHKPPLVEPGDERRIEALTVAMALAPGVYTRNRMFDFFAKGAVQRARSRAATVRGIVPHLLRAQTVSIANEGPHTTTGEPSFVLRYRIPSVRLARVVELSRAELAALRVLAARANVHVLPVADADHAVVDATLARLIHLGDDTSDLARAARDSAAPPPGD